MLQKIPKKSPNKFICKKCDYNTNNLKDYNKHCETTKHNAIYATKKSPTQCPCGKQYKHLSSFYRHRKICKHYSNNTSPSLPPLISTNSANIVKNFNDNKMVKNDNKMVIPKNHLICKCGKIYKFQSGLSRHKKVCVFKDTSNNIVLSNEIEQLESYKDQLDKVTEMFKQSLETNKE